MSKPAKPPRSQVEKLLYDRREAAAALSISTRTLDYFLANGRLKARRVGRKVLIPRAELLRFAREDHFGPVKGISDA